MEVKLRAFSAPALCPAFTGGHCVLFQTGSTPRCYSQYIYVWYIST